MEVYIFPLKIDPSANSTCPLQKILPSIFPSKTRSFHMVSPYMDADLSINNFFVVKIVPVKLRSSMMDLIDLR